jgi:hypothetical protein
MMNDQLAPAAGSSAEHEGEHHRPRHRHRRTRRAASWLFGLLAAYLLAAYLLIPLVWEAYVHRHPSLDDNPRMTQTGDGHPGDPLNVSLIGTKDELAAIMKAAGWYPAAALGLRSDLRIGVDSVLSRPDDEAPVSSLYLFGRKEDVAYEQPVGDNPRQRHHVRFWKSEDQDADERPIWLGSATYDESVGLSHTTGQVTHHINGDIDAERDHLFGELEATGKLAEQWTVDDYHHVDKGRNGGGDEWHTDGRLFVGRIAGGSDATPAR